MRRFPLALLLVAAAARWTLAAEAVPLGEGYSQAVTGFIQGLPPQLRGAAVAYLNSSSADPALLQSLLASPDAAPAPAPDQVQKFIADSSADSFESARKLETLKLALASRPEGAGAIASLALASRLVRGRVDKSKLGKLDEAIDGAKEIFEVRSVENLLAPQAAAASSRKRTAARLRASFRLPDWIPAGLDARRALDGKLAAEESAVLKNAEGDAARFFLALRRQALDFKGKAREFPYPIVVPVIKRIMLDLSTRLGEDLADKDRAALEKLLTRGQALLDENAPYASSVRFSFDYLEALDRVFDKLHPNLTGSFHRNHAERVLEPTLKRAPDVLLYPSFAYVGFSYFVNTRAAPFHVVGLDASGLRPNEPTPFADGFFMKPSEFAWHDIGHIEFMAMRDFDYLDHTFKPLERVVQEWDLTGKRVIGYWQSLKDNKNLYDATCLILFEILHERGYQYSLAVLKAQLDTPKWTEILLRKRDNNYYKEFTNINYGLFGELENARQGLLRFVDEARRKDQKQHIAALYGTELAVRVTHFPKVRYGRGTFERVELVGAPDAEIVLRGEDGTNLAPRASDLILAQVNPTQAWPLDAAARTKINAALAAIKAHASVSWEGRERRIVKVILSAGQEARAEFADQASAPLAKLSFPGKAAKVIEDRHFFELEQVLGAAERAQPLSFTQQDRSRVYLGVVRYGLRAGEETVVVRQHDGVEVELPLSEVLVDPLQKSDFNKLEKKKR